MFISDSNLSRAWARAFLMVYDGGTTSPLVVTIDDFRDWPEEDPLIEAAVGTLLEDLGCNPIGTTASSIFPQSLWNPDADRTELYDRYNKILPRLMALGPNRRGTYFQRLIAYGDDGINQLEHIIQAWNAGTRRRSALIASLFDPLSDHNRAPRMGFPCLHQVCFDPVGDDGMAVTGFYATQYIVDRAYGNYLGLARLGRFIAMEIGRRLTRCTCVASRALQGAGTKGALREFAEAVRGASGKGG